MIPVNIQLLHSTLNNPFTRFFLSTLGYCNQCKQNLLEVTLDLYTGEKETACMQCNLTERILSKIVLVSGKLFGVEEQDLKNIIK